MGSQNSVKPLEFPSHELYRIFRSGRWIDVRPKDETYEIEDGEYLSLQDRDGNFAGNAKVKATTLYGKDMAWIAVRESDVYPDYHNAQEFHQHQQDLYGSKWDGFTTTRVTKFEVYYTNDQWTEKRKWE